MIRVHFMDKDGTQRYFADLPEVPRDGDTVVMPNGSRWVVCREPVWILGDTKHSVHVTVGLSSSRFPPQGFLEVAGRSKIPRARTGVVES